MKNTPENITKLESNEIFVFGSNLAGRHGAGAALLALKKFGAISGQGYGLMGQSYGIATKDERIQTLSLDRIQVQVNKFLRFAENNSEKTFLVTQIGCGLAGYSPKDIAPLFKGFSSNVILPESFSKILNN